MRQVKEINRSRNLKPLSVTLGIILVLFISLFHLMFNLPATLMSIYTYYNQLNSDWHEQRDENVGIVFEYPSSWVIQQDRGAPNLPNYMSELSKCTGAESRTDQLFVRICTNPDVKKIEQLFNNNFRYAYFGGNKYLILHDSVNYDVGRALISADGKYWMEFSYYYLSDIDPFTNKIKNKILTRIANSVKNLNQ